MRELLDPARANTTDPYNLTRLYAARGEKDQAFEWFDRALQTNSEDMHGQARMIRYDPLLDPLRSDPRFADLLRQHNKASLLGTP
jgi:hypothetical protein